MKIRTQRWRPDTCDCIVELTYDLDEPDDTRTHTVTNVIRACQAHVGMNASQLNTVLFDENRRKNRLHGRAAELYPALFPLMDEPGGGRGYDFSRISWSYDATRTLRVTIQGITAPQRNAIQRAADQLFGTGKVVIS